MFDKLVVDKQNNCHWLRDTNNIYSICLLLIYQTSILKHFVGTPSNISSRVSDLLNNLKCPSMTDYRWYQDVFTSRVMLRKDCHKPYWKEKFVDGLPPIFAHKVKQVLMGKNDSIDYDNLTYGDIFSAIKKLGINMCNDEKLLKYHLQNIYIYIYITETSEILIIFHVSTIFK